jgi:hypothetical protein
MAHIIDPIVGANITRRTQTSEHRVGTVTKGNDGNSYIYVGPAANAISAAAACTVTGAFAVNATAGNYTTDAAFATGDYGWVRKTASPF